MSLLPVFRGLLEQGSVPLLEAYECDHSVNHSYSRFSMQGEGFLPCDRGRGPLCPGHSHYL